MRVLHTSDWHLGKDIGSLDRTETFGKFLRWLLETIRTEHVDTLIVSGDVFDTTTPSHRAQSLYYSFLAQLSESGCRHAVITAGNHDSPSLINAPSDLLSHMGIHAVGTVGENELIAVRDADEALQAVVLAVPYLRERDVFRAGDYRSEEDRSKALALAIAGHYERLVQQALTLMKNERVPIIATGHLFVSGGVLDDSVRKLYIGYLGNIPADIFPRQIDYLALGHLHRPQLVGGDPARAYSGSPLPLDFSEAETEKSVRIVDFEPGKPPAVRPVPVPAFERLETVSGTGAQILARIAELAAADEPVIVRVIHRGESPEPGLAEQVRSIVEGSPVLIAETRDESLVHAYLEGKDVHTLSVGELTPAQVLSRRLDCEGIQGDERAELEKRFEIALEALQNKDPLQ
jgi:exonuclease SbcD